MQKKSGFWGVFLVVAFLCVVILGLSLSGRLKFLSFLEKPTAAIQSFSYNLFRKLPFVSEDLKSKRLKEKNLELLGRVADYEKLQKENAALSDQFQTAYPADHELLQAEVISAPGFIPGVSIPNILILNKGSRDGLKTGQAVVVKNNLVGLIAKVSVNLSEVNALNNPSSFFTAKTENGAAGVVKNQGGLTLDNVLLSESIKEGELVLTKGDIDSEGAYVPPDLVIGKIISVEKNPSALFQKAKIESFVDFTKLNTTFVYLGVK